MSSFLSSSLCIINPMLSMNFKQRAKCFHVGEGGGAGEEEAVGGRSFFFEFMSTIHTRILEPRISFDASLDAILN